MVGVLDFGFCQLGEEAEDAEHLEDGFVREDFVVPGEVLGAADEPGDFRNAGFIPSEFFEREFLGDGGEDLVEEVVFELVEIEIDGASEVIEAFFDTVQVQKSPDIRGENLAG